MEDLGEKSRGCGGFLSLKKCKDGQIGRGKGEARKRRLRMTSPAALEGLVCDEKKKTGRRPAARAEIREKLISPITPLIAKRNKGPYTDLIGRETGRGSLKLGKKKNRAGRQLEEEGELLDGFL